MKTVYLVSKYADKGNVTQALQATIDVCAQAGGGQVRFQAGTYITGTLELRSNVELYLDAGAVLRGDDDCHQYSNRYWEEAGDNASYRAPVPERCNALICAYNQHNIAILGEGTIDGADCYDPEGEQNFRGPHGIFLYGCSQIALKGFSLVRSANYSMYMERCHHIHLDNLKICGGQDALHLRKNRYLMVEDCDFRTGDDCVSGFLNEDFTFLNCQFNTPGAHMFCVSCLRLTMRGCRFWGPGEYPAVFKENKRYSNGDAAICLTHRYVDEQTIASDDWLLEDITMENISCPLCYDWHRKEMAGHQGKFVIQGICVYNFVRPILVAGMPGSPFELTIRNGVFVRRADAAASGEPFLRGEYCHKIELDTLELTGFGAEKILRLSHVDQLRADSVRVSNPLQADQLMLNNVPAVEVYRSVPTEHSPYIRDQQDSLIVSLDCDDTFRGARKYVNF